MNYSYPQDLPISSEKDKIVKALQQHQVLIIAGDTGSGKTTQLPKMCLEALPDNKLMIGCTQPRRIAATSVSARVAEELGDAGDQVGYKIRFHNQTSSATRIKFMTDGVLLAETRSDRQLSQYGVIIVDEAHERSLNIDFLLGYLKQLLHRRPDLKLIITSATIDTSAFSKHFNNAPVIEVTGRTYPVTVHYKPPEEVEEGGSEATLEHCVNVVEELFLQRPKGDILVFLATERDIKECCRLLEKRTIDAMVLPLFGRLPSGDQRRIFQQSRQLKIIVATNVAETSLTVPGIRYVIDSGYARISQYNVRAKTTSLPVTRVSRASCDQRQGRCGRVGPGVCIRLYSEDDYLERDEYTVPEIKRSNLAEVILQMTSLGLGQPETFPFVDPPYKNAITEGYRLLRELGAIDQKKSLTSNGKFMAQLPIDPCISRVILEAKEHNCLREIKIISSVLAIQDPRIRPSGKEREADTAHQKFAHRHSDFMALLQIWQTFHKEAGRAKSWSALKKFCKAHFLSFQRMREWFDLHDQLDRIVSKKKGFVTNSVEASYQQIHQSLLSGFLRNLAKKKQSRLFQGCHNKELMIFPGSGQFTKPPQWVLAANFIETSRLFAHTVAAIEPEWIEPIASHLCTYSWTAARWQKKAGRVVAEETVSLFGLIISSGNLVNFGRRDKKNEAEARKIFIQSALVEGQLQGSYPFLAANLKKIRGWQESEDKLRIRNLVGDDLSFYHFYEQKLAAGIFDQRSFNRFLTKKKNQKFLLMSDDDILLRHLDDNELVNFPASRTIGNLQVRLEYHFEPGSDQDGVTFRLPISFADSVSPDHFDWLVPGLLSEKLTFLLKSLPKSIRKKLIPLSDTVSRILDDLDFGKGPLLPRVEQSILKQFSFLIGRSDWKLDFPPHLQPRFLLFDDNGKECCSGRSLKDLVRTVGSQALPPNAANYSTAEKEILGRWENSEHREWAFAGLPDEIATRTKSGETSGFLYSALSPERNNGTVRVIFTRDQKKARRINRQGTFYLIGLQAGQQYRALKKLCTTSLSGPSTLFFLQLGKPRSEIVELTIDYLLSHLIGPLSPGIITKSDFEKITRKIEEKGLFAETRQYLEQLLASLRKKRELEELITKTFLRGRQKGHFLPPLEEEFFSEIEAILPVDFLTSDPTRDFHQVNRQFEGLRIRVERFYANPAKDAQKKEQLEPYITRLRKLQQRIANPSAEAAEELQRYQQMVSEFRLSLFAPEIRLGQSVSAKKLDKQWQRVLSNC
jgi:ATP-dependent helicase HrpA